MSNELSIIDSLSPSTMDQAIAFASKMAEAKLIPLHLQKSPADCLRIVLQAARWQLDPFAVAEKTSIIQGKMMYEGQLVSAVVNSRGGLSSRISYAFAGEGTSRVLTVSGTLKGEDKPREIILSHAQALKINKNGQMAANPDQQMCYIGARIWARRHTPELMLGVYTPDESDDEQTEKNVTDTAEAEKRPAPPPRSKKGLAAVQENSEKPAEAPVDVATSAVVDALVSKISDDPLLVRGNGISKEARKELKDGEKLVAICSVESFSAFEPLVENVKKPSVKAVLKGEFEGPANHLGGATRDGDKLVPDAIWNIERPMKFHLRGQKNSRGDVKIVVDKIEEVGTAPQSEQAEF